MTNVLYPKWKQAVVEGAADSALTGTGSTGLWVALVDLGSYTYSAAHQFYSSLSGIASEVEVTSVTTALALIDGDDVTLPSVPAGPNCEALVLYRKNAGANTTWRLVGLIDTGVTNLPVTPNGGDIDIQWNAGGIFQL